MLIVSVFCPGVIGMCLCWLLRPVLCLLVLVLLLIRVLYCYCLCSMLFVYDKCYCNGSCHDYGRCYMLLFTVYCYYSRYWVCKILIVNC